MFAEYKNCLVSTFSRVSDVSVETLIRQFFLRHDYYSRTAS